MDVLIPVLLVVLVTFAFFYSLKVRVGATKGGITERPAPPGTTSGSAQDTVDGEDRESFRSRIDAPGTR